MTKTPANCQQHITELTSTHYNAVVVGAGPAGSSAARCLAEAGRSVLLIDKAKFPRRKVCGDGLIADSIEFLKKHNLLDRVAAEANYSTAATVISPSGHSFDCPGAYYVLARERFDMILATAAVEKGAIFAQGAIADIRYDDQSKVSVYTKDSDQPFTADYCLIATGGQTKLAQGCDLIGKPAPHAFALGRYLRSTAELPNLFIYFDRAIIPGFAWIWPMGDGLFNVGAGATFRVGTKPGKLAGKAMNRMLEESEVGCELMAKGEFVSEIKGAPLFCNFNGSSVWDKSRIVAAGETIGTTYSFTGEGIGKAMETGWLAGGAIAKAIDNSDPNELSFYEAQINLELKPKYKNYRIAEAFFSHGWLNDFLCKRLNRSPHLLKKFAELAADRAKVSKLGSAIDLAKSYWK